jgi:molecular chaperone DnaK (HSP70)
MVESSAAAMGYGLFAAGKKTVLVFDMGGGTTDVSVILIDEGKYEVVAVDGHNSCGGQNFDNVMLELVTLQIGRGKKQLI